MKRLLSALFLAMISLSAARAALQVSANVDPQLLNFGEATQYRLEIRGVSNPSAPQLPAVDGLRMQGPGVSSHTSIVNGRIDRSATFTWNILPSRPGEFTIPGFTYKHGRESAVVEPVRITVAEGRSENSSRNRLFLSTDAPATNLFVGQNFEIILALHYRQINIGREIEIFGLPEQGVERLAMQEIQGGRRNIDNLIYDVRRFRIAFRASEPGSLSIQPALRVRVATQNQRGRRNSFDDPFGSPFGDMFFGGRNYETYNVTTEELVFQINPLPREERPADFTGNTGQFRMEASVTPDKLPAGEPVTVTIRIEGTGNMDAVSAPRLPPLDGLRAYDARLTGRRQREDGLGGIKEFEQVLIPATEHITEIPAYKFSYFDPEKGTYETLSAGPFPIAVTPSESSRMVQLPSSVNRIDDTPLGLDLLYLKPAPNSSGNTAARLLEKPWFLAVHAMGLVLPLLMLSYRRRRRFLENNIAHSRRLKAPKTARAGLKRAQTALDADNPSACHEAVFDALNSYFCNRFNWAPGQFDRTTLLKTLGEHGLDEKSILTLEDTLTQCEAFRYGGTDTFANRDAWSTRLQELREILNSCERIRL